MIILGIETSCDETALCLLETHKNENDFEYRILGNIIHSQIDLHKEYGGVYPNLAKREHIKNLPILFEKIKKDAGIDEKNINTIAVTRGPGLEPALWTGITFADDLNKKYNIPVIPVNHMEGHIASTLVDTSEVHTDFRKIKKLNTPALALLISGGHTELVKVKDFGSYEILGSTRDDAVGEAFDKVARMLGLPYPGGPEISRLAKIAREEIKEKSGKTKIENKIILPRPMINSKDLNFSFSGLKTAVLYIIKKLGNLTIENRKEISREFENAVTEVLISKTKKALEDNEYKTLIIGGGVIANEHIRNAFTDLVDKFNIPLYLPPRGLTGDNALMIALVAMLSSYPSDTKNSIGIKAHGNLSLGN